MKKFEIYSGTKLLVTITAINNFKAMSKFRKLYKNTWANNINFSIKEIKK
jgi:hypothetical protein